MNWPQIYTCSYHPELHLPPYPIPLGCPQASALSALLHASNLHWSSILPVVMYMFQFYSLKSPHPCLLPLSPKVCSLHLCLLFCPACRIIRTVFLNFIWRRCGEKGSFLHFWWKTNWYSHYGEQCRDSLKNWE